MEKWYVIQVRTGYEEKVAFSCGQLIHEECLKECFIATYTKLKKINGQWLEVTEKLFPGYVFLVSDDINQLYQELKQIPTLTKLLGRYGHEVFPLAEDEVVFLKALGKEEHVVEMSVGYIEGDSIVVTQGPLKDIEGLIKKIDRHKRIAYIEVEFLGQRTNAKVGLEVINKK